MRILIAALIIGLTAVSCAPGGPLTPADAFSDFGRALAAKDPAALHGLLSAKSGAKIVQMCRAISAMPAGQRQALAESVGAPENALENLTPHGYVTHFIINRAGTNPVMQAFSGLVRSAEIKNGRALVRLDNGMELPFVKEGPYWRFDLDAL